MLKLEFNPITAWWLTCLLCPLLLFIPQLRVICQPSMLSSSLEAVFKNMPRVCLTFAWRKILLKIVYYWFKSKFPPVELTQITKTFRASEFAVRNEATFCLNFTSTWSQPGLRSLCFQTVWTLVVVFPVSMLCSVTTQTQRAWTCLPLYLVHCLTPSLHTRPQVLQILDCRWWLWSKKDCDLWWLLRAGYHKTCRMNVVHHAWKYVLGGEKAAEEQRDRKQEFILVPALH